MKMDACITVEKEVDRVVSKFNDLSRQTCCQLQECVLEIQKIKQELAEMPPDTELSAAHSLLLSSSIKKIKDSVQTLSCDHKDLHSSVSKVGKAIDRNFVSDYSAIVPDGLSSPESITEVNHVICEHFLRQGMLDIAETLVKDSGLQLEHAQKEPFLELHGILEALKQHDLKLALTWVETNKEKLRAQNSSLEFKLHRLQFIELVQQGSERQLDALLYARHFEPFAHTYTKEIQVCFIMVLYVL